MPIRLTTITETIGKHSQIDDDSEIWEDSEKGEEGKLVISEWLATQKGWQ